MFTDEGEEGGDSQREQYRIVKKDLLFQVNFTSQHNKYMGDESTQTERTLSDFRKLGQSLQKLFPGCYIPLIPRWSASENLPQSIFDFRKTPLECAQVDNFCRKLKQCQYLLDSDCVQLFMDPRIFQVQLDGQLQHLVKTSNTQADILNRFKQGFNNLSGKTVDSQTFDKIDRFKAFLTEQQKHLIRSKVTVEKAMTNKVDYDTQKVRLLNGMADLEEFIANDLMQSNFTMRAEQRVLDKYSEVNNDTHWRALEMIDDFIRDQLSDCQSFFDVFSDISRAH